MGGACNTHVFFCGSRREHLQQHLEQKTWGREVGNREHRWEDNGFEWHGVAVRGQA